jgi:lysophospholipase L1-like esterase
MRRLNGSLAVACLYVIAQGCAAELGNENSVASDLDVETQALSDARLLALGDSIAFGYNPFGDFTKDKNFSGYPEVLKSDYSVKNASCPGETSASFYNASAPDNGCRAYRAAYPLHVNYGSNATQLDYAISRLTSTEPEDVPTLITLNISGNDIFLLQGSCASNANPAQCFADGAPALIGSVTNNVVHILSAIVNTGYHGRIVYQTLYSTDYATASTVGFLNALNGTVSNYARMFGAQIADGYGAFQAAAGSQTPCAAGLLIPNPAGGCDVHPTAAGQAVLAQSVRDAH